jgi:hypothetical protein
MRKKLFCAKKVTTLPALTVPNKLRPYMCFSEEASQEEQLLLVGEGRLAAAFIHVQGGEGGVERGVHLSVCTV